MSILPSPEFEFIESFERHGRWRRGLAYGYHCFVFWRRSSALVLAIGLLPSCSVAHNKPTVLPSLLSTAGAKPRMVPSDAPHPILDAATPQGASAFARYWYSQIEQAYIEKNPQLVASLSTADCRACARYVASITAERDQMQSVTGVQYRIILAEAPGFRGPRVRVDVIYDSPGAVRIDLQGKIIEIEAAVKNRQVELTLVRDGQHWRVSEERGA